MAKTHGGIYHSSTWHLINKKQWKAAGILIILLLSLRVRDNEAFRPLTFVLIVILTTILTIQTYLRSWKTPRLFCVATLILFLGYDSTSELLQNRLASMYPQSEMSSYLAEELESHETILLLHGNVWQYRELERVAPTPFHYLYPWLYASDRIRANISETLKQKTATWVVSGTTIAESYPVFGEILQENYQMSASSSTEIVWRKRE